MVIDLQSPEVEEFQPLSARWPDSCKAETVCDTTSECVTSPLTPVKAEYDVMDATGRGGGARRLGKMAAASNSTSAGSRRRSGVGSVRIEERRFRCAECFKAFKFKHHLQVLPRAWLCSSNSVNFINALKNSMNVIISNVKFRKSEMQIIACINTNNFYVIAPC